MSIDRVDGPGGLNRPDKLVDTTNSASHSGNASPDGDRLDISDEVRLVADLARRAQALPEVREDRVDVLRLALVEGGYDPEAQGVARAILEFEDGLGT